MTRLVLPAIIALTVAAILWQWHQAVGFDPLDARWWQWAVQSAIHPAGLPEAMSRAATLTGISGVLLAGLVPVLLGRAGNRTRKGGFRPDELHGTARWATTQDVKQTGLIDDKGVVVGGWPGMFGTRTLRHDGPEHVMVFAPTRSGKGVSLILPTLLSWPDSVLVLDIKGENHALSAGYRHSLGHKVLKFEPTALAGSARFNPLAEIRLGSQAIQDCQNMAAMIVDPDGKGLKDYWMREGWAWLSTALLHVVYRVQKEDGRDACLADVNGFLSGVKGGESDDDDGFSGLLEDMIAFEHEDPAIDAEVRRGAARMRLKAPQERSGVHSSAITGMALFADPIVARNTAECDFRVADLMNGPTPAALYLLVPPSDIDRLRPLLRILLNLFIRRLTETMAFAGGASVKHYKHRLLLMLDEFTSVGKLEIVEKALAYMAGYGLKGFIVVQDVAQVHQAYGKDESITSNCHVRVAFAPNRYETAQWIANLAGKATVVQARRSRSGKLGEGASVSDSEQEAGRMLLTPDEAMRLKGLRKGRFGKVIPGETLVFVAGHAPIRGVQRLYFQDKVLRRRARMAPPEDMNPASAKETAHDA
ncbi:MAG: conjugal transfer protein TraG [Rhodospirillaceae bacterium BRH_c57]|nr:MAG: conjugal transfer protein TraG [Rhodospirillaceae bacterium BRH_c57]